MFKKTTNWLELFITKMYSQSRKLQLPNNVGISVLPDILFFAIFYFKVRICSYNGEVRLSLVDVAI